MASPAGIVGGLLGSAASEAAAFAAGVAIGPTLAPEVRFLVNEAWQLASTHPLDPSTAAAIAAESIDSLDAMRTQAAYNGIASHLFDDLYNVTLTAPGLGTLLQLLRRDQTTAVDFPHGLRKAKLEPVWDAALTALRDEPLGPDVIAVAIQRGVIAAPFALPYAPPAGVGNVAAYPASSLDATIEAAWSGETVERLRVRTALAGLPLSLELAARGHFRGVLQLDDFERAVLEGNTRGEWGAAALEVAREILTANQYAELQLRGFYDRATRLANTAKHGMSDADSDLLYNVLGRGLGVHAITTALARGGTFGGTYAAIPEPYRSALQRANTREEFAGLAYANRYSYPSAFVLRSLSQSGAISAATTHQTLLDIGWPPAFVDEVTAAWTGGTTAAGDKHVTRAQSSLFTALHKAYVAEEADAAGVAPGLTALAIAATAQAQVLALWTEERALIRRQLSPAQITKAVKEGVTNPATAAPWSQADGLAALLARGYSSADATTLLEE